MLNIDSLIQLIKQHLADSQDSLAQSDSILQSFIGGYNSIEPEKLEQELSVLYNLLLNENENDNRHKDIINALASLLEPPPAEQKEMLGFLHETKQQLESLKKSTEEAPPPQSTINDILKQQLSGDNQAEACFYEIRKASKSLNELGLKNINGRLLPNSLSSCSLITQGIISYENPGDTPAPPLEWSSLSELYKLNKTYEYIVQVSKMSTWDFLKNKQPATVNKGDATSVYSYKANPFPFLEERRIPDKVYQYIEKTLAGKAQELKLLDKTAAGHSSMLTNISTAIYNCENNDASGKLKNVLQVILGHLVLNGEGLLNADNLTAFKQSKLEFSISNFLIINDINKSIDEITLYKLRLIFPKTYPGEKDPDSLKDFLKDYTSNYQKYDEKNKKIILSESQVAALNNLYNHLKSNTALAQINLFVDTTAPAAPAFVFNSAACAALRQVLKLESSTGDDNIKKVLNDAFNRDQPLSNQEKRLATIVYNMANKKEPTQSQVDSFVDKVNLLVDYSEASRNFKAAIERDALFWANPGVKLFNIKLRSPLFYVNYIWTQWLRPILLAPYAKSLEAINVKMNSEAETQKKSQIQAAVQAAVQQVDFSKNNPLNSKDLKDAFLAIEKDSDKISFLENKGLLNAFQEKALEIYNIAYIDRPSKDDIIERIIIQLATEAAKISAAPTAITAAAGSSNDDEPASLITTLPASELKPSDTPNTDNSASEHIGDATKKTALARNFIEPQKQISPDADSSKSHISAAPTTLRPGGGSSK